MAKKFRPNNPLQPGLYEGTLVWCHPQIGAIAKQVKHPILSELFHAQREQTGAVKQLYTTFARQFAEYHILHARLLSTNAFAYATDRFKSDPERILANYDAECARVGLVTSEAIAYDGNLALLAPNTAITDDVSFTVIGQGNFFVPDEQTFIGDVNGAIRRTNISDPSSKAGKKSRKEQQVLHDFYTEYFVNPQIALQQLNYEITQIRADIDAGNISDLFICRKLKSDPPKKPKTLVQRIAVEQGLKEGDTVTYRTDIPEIEMDIFGVTRDYKPLGTLATVAYMAGIRGPHLNDFLTKRVEPNPVSLRRAVQTELF